MKDVILLNDVFIFVSKIKCISAYSHSSTSFSIKIYFQDDDCICSYQKYDSFECAKNEIKKILKQIECKI